MADLQSYSLRFVSNSPRDRRMHLTIIRAVCDHDAKALAALEKEKWNATSGELYRFDADERPGRQLKPVR